MGQPFHNLMSNNLVLDQSWLKRISHILEQADVAQLTFDPEQTKLETTSMDFLTAAKYLHITARALLESAQKADWMTAVGDFENFDADKPDAFHISQSFAMLRRYRLPPHDEQAYNLSGYGDSGL